MALHVSPEILEQYHGFYSLALDGTTDDGCALVLENVPAAGLRAALEAVPEPDALLPNSLPKSEWVMSVSLCCMSWCIWACSGGLQVALWQPCLWLGQFTELSHLIE